MAKHGKPSARPDKASARPSSGHAARPELDRNSRPATQPNVPSQASSRSEPASPPRRSTYFEAVALYEEGLQKLQRHEYRVAADIFESVLRQYTEEKELHERVRLYLNICQRQAEPHEAAPQSLEERLYASTLALNGGRYDEAISHLRLVRDEDPDNDHALYMLAVAHAQRGELAEAMAHLERAIAVNPENRAVARNDPDLDPLRDDESFRSAMDVAPVSRGDRRRPFRPRSSR